MAADETWPSSMKPISLFHNDVTAASSAESRNPSGLLLVFSRPGLARASQMVQDTANELEPLRARRTQ